METARKSIYQAAAEDDIEALQHHLAKVNAPDPDTDWTALHYAAEQNAGGAAKWLLDNGADPEAVANGVTPLDVVSGEAVRHLLLERIQPNQVDLV